MARGYFWSGCTTVKNTRYCINKHGRSTIIWSTPRMWLSKSCSKYAWYGIAVVSDDNSYILLGSLFSPSAYLCAELNYSKCGRFIKTDSCRCRRSSRKRLFITSLCFLSRIFLDIWWGARSIHCSMQITSHNKGDFEQLVQKQSRVMVLSASQLAKTMNDKSWDVAQWVFQSHYQGV